MTDEPEPKRKGPGKPSYRTALDLPLPPSTNRLWRQSRGKFYKSPEYQSWLTQAGWELVTQRPIKIPSPVALTFKAGIPDRARRDLDNCIKAVLDLLEAHGVVQNDVSIVEIRALWDRVVPSGRVRLEIWRTTEPATRAGAEGRAKVSRVTRAAFAALRRAAP